MGAGKSSVAKGLSEKLNYTLLELDDQVISLSGVASVKDIFDQFGEGRFRELEAEALLIALQADSPQVVSTGGGILSRSSNQELLKKSSAIILLLNASFDTIERRLEGDSKRPLFKDIERAKQLYAERQSKYEEAADFKIETDDLAIEEVIEKIISLEL